MKISELAAYRENLISMKLKNSLLAMQSELDPVIHTVANNHIQLPENLAQLTHHRDQIMQGLKDFDREIDRLLDNLLEMIKALEPIYLSRSYQLYEDGLRGDSIDHILNRRFSIDQQTQNFIQSRIQFHSKWQYAGMIIRPGLENWISDMVACDPVYLIDTKQELFHSVRDKFNNLYQNRLRYYAVNETEDLPIMASLPDNQFGLILVYNFFHYKPFEIMRRYLEEIYVKLKPGGVLCLTFNDCDRRGAVELAERMYTCYTPGRMVLAICEMTGFQIEQNYRIDAAVNWLELKKPGQMSSIRGGQALAKIVAKSK